MQITRRAARFMAIRDQAANTFLLRRHADRCSERSSVRAELVSPTSACVGESSRWDPRHRCVWWVGNEHATVHRYEPERNGTDGYVLLQNACSLARTVSGDRLLATLPDGVYSVAGDGSELELLAPLKPGDARSVFNDSDCETAGRLWIGTGSDCRRHRPQPRRPLVRSPVDLVAGCAFEGAQLSDLYRWALCPIGSAETGTR